MHTQVQERLTPASAASFNAVTRSDDYLQLIDILLYCIARIWQITFKTILAVISTHIRAYMYIYKAIRFSIKYPERHIDYVHPTQGANLCRCQPQTLEFE